MGNGQNNNLLKSSHFWIIVSLLLALLITEILVFVFIDTASDRKDMMAITFGAFGAWIGAGAAYFFGKDNLQTATESMLKMKGRSPADILSGTTLRDMKPKTIPKFFTESDNIKTTMDWLEEDVDRFFAVVVGDKGTYEYAIDEEALYRYIHDSIHEKKDIDTIHKTPLKEAIDYFKKNKKLQKLVQAGVTKKETTTAVVANDEMENERKFITIVVDDDNKPIGYITTADIRRLLASAK